MAEVNNVVDSVASVNIRALTRYLMSQYVPYYYSTHFYSTDVSSTQIVYTEAFAYEFSGSFKVSASVFQFAFTVAE